MTTDFDFYDLLEISEDASKEEIKKAFRQKVREYHPDLNDDPRARAQFTAVKKAYDILGDSVERQAYDRLGHEDYVAKRTSGIPSPDLWKPTDSSSEDDSGVSSTTTDKAHADSSQKQQRDSSAGTRREATGSERTGSSSRTTSRSTASSRTSSTAEESSTSTADSTTGERRSKTASQTEQTNQTSQATGGATATSAGQQRATGATAGAATGVGSTDGGTTSTRQTTRRTADTGTRSGKNPITRWWQRQNFAWPLIWSSLLIYLVGIGQFVLENQSALTTVGVEASTLSNDPEALWAAYSTGRHGVAEPLQLIYSVDSLTLLTSIEALEPLAQLEVLEWYGVLAGLVLLSLLLVLGGRILWRENTWGPVSIDETMVVAIAVGVSATLYGGPLLAGALLMPLLFGVVVRRTRQLPGWSPSYLYVLCVLAPVAGLAAAIAGYTSLLGDLVLFVLIPVFGALALPLRASIRKRLGR